MSDNCSATAQQNRGAVTEAWRTLMRTIGLGRNGSSAVRASLE